MSFFRNIISLAKEVVSKIFAFKTSEISTETKPDFNTYGGVYGGPAISGFSSVEGYIQIENMFKPVSGDTWEIMTKFQIFGNDWGTILSNENDWNGLELKAKPNKLYVSGFTPNYEYVFRGEYTVTLSKNIWYWVKYSYDGTTYKVLLSTTGEFNGEETTVCSAIDSRIICSNANKKLRIGRSASDWSDSHYLYGAIQIESYYIKVNDSYLFNGSTAVKGTDYTISTSYGSLIILKEYEYGNFAKNSYIRIPVRKPTTSLDFIVKVKTPEWYSGYSPIQATSSCKGIIFRLYSSDWDSGPRIWMSSNGTSWNICEGHYLNLNIPTNTELYLRVLWDGSIYKFGYSTDKENWNYGSTVTNNNPVYWNEGYQNLGGCSWEDYSFYGGIICPKESSLTIDGELVWNGYNYPLGIGSSIKINEGMGLSSYRWSAYNSITSNSNEFTLNSVIRDITTDEDNNTIYEIDEPDIDIKTIEFNGASSTYDGYSCSGETNYYLVHGDIINTDAQGNIINQFYVKAQDGTASPASVTAKIARYDLTTITSTGSQYINTGYILKANDKVTTKFKINSWDGNYDAVFGARNGSMSSKQFVLFNNYDWDTRFGYGRTNSENADYWNERHTYTVVAQNNSCSIKDEDSNYTSTLNTSGTLEDCVNTCGLFAFNNDGSGFRSDYSPSRLTMYYFKVEDSDGNLKLNLIPAKDGAGVVCMYDTVSGTFKYNVGSGNFTAGNVTKSYMTINDNNYDRNDDIDFAIEIPLDTVITNTTDTNYNVNVIVDQDNLDKFDTSASLTTANTKIDTTTYFKFDYEKLTGYNTKLIISGQVIEDYVYPIYVTSDKVISLNMNKTSDLTQCYTKSFKLSQDMYYRKLALTFSPGMTVDKIKLIVNSTCIWEFDNVSNATIDVYNGDVINYIIEKDGYETVNDKFTVNDVYTSSTKTINVNLTRVYRYILNITPDDAKVEFVANKIYKTESNWIQVYSGSYLKYIVSKDGYDTHINEISAVDSDATINITLTALSQNDIIAKADYINVNNYGCEIYKDSNDHYIASGIKTSSTYSNYKYVTEDVLLPIATSRNWELRTAFRYVDGASYCRPIISTAKGIKFTYEDSDYSYYNLNDSGINLYLYSYDNSYQLYLSYALNENTVLFSENPLEYHNLAKDYEYRVKIGQTQSDIPLTSEGGLGTSSTIYVDIAKSDRNNTNNIELSSNSGEYSCSSSDNNSNAWYAFNSNNNIWSNTTETPSIQNPIWITYYTPTAIKPRSVTIVNDATFNNMKNGTIEGSTDNSTWDILYTITDRPQSKNLRESYKINTNNKYNYIRVKITERYSDYKQNTRDYYMVNNSQLDITIKSNFFNQGLYENNDNGIAEFKYTSIGWTLNDNQINYKNYFTYSGLNIVGELNNQNGVYLGFSGSNYINMINNLDSSSVTEMQIKFTTGSNVNDIQNLIFGTDQDDKVFFNIYNGYIQLCNKRFGTTTRDSHQNTNLQILPETTYWFKMTQNVNSIDTYISSDGINWTQGSTVTKNNNNYGTWIGTANQEQNYYFKGSIDINETYVKIGNDYYFNGASKINPQIGDNFQVYYSTKINTLPVTATNIKQIIIDGFPFTYNNGYTRILTYTQNAPQYNIVNGKLVENSNYIAKKNPDTRVPFSFLATPIDIANRYMVGHIDLTETKCYIDGQLYWSAINDFNVNDKVNINKSYGLTNSTYSTFKDVGEIKGITTRKGEVKSITDDNVTIIPLEKLDYQVTIVDEDNNDSIITTSNEIPDIYNITLNIDQNDANIKLDTYMENSAPKYPNNKYRYIHFESIPGEVVKLNLAGQVYTIDDTNPVLDIRLVKTNIENNVTNRYAYKITYNGSLVEEKTISNLPDYDILKYVHTFKVVPTGITGATITYTIGNKVMTTTDGSCNCYSEQVINWTVVKTGYITETGTYKVPIYGTCNNTFTHTIEMNSINTLTLNSSENDSIYILTCTGYEQENNTITTKRGNMILEGDNLIEPELINNGCTITEA